MSTIVTRNGLPIFSGSSPIDWFRLFNPIYENKLVIDSWMGHSVFNFNKSFTFTLSEAIINNEVKVFEFNRIQNAYIDVTNKYI